MKVTQLCDVLSVMQSDTSLNSVLETVGNVSIAVRRVITLHPVPILNYAGNVVNLDIHTEVIRNTKLDVQCT